MQRITAAFPLRPQTVSANTPPSSSLPLGILTLAGVSSIESNKLPNRNAGEDKDGTWQGSVILGVCQDSTGLSA